MKSARPFLKALLDFEIHSPYHMRDDSTLRDLSNTAWASCLFKINLRDLRNYLYETAKENGFCLISPDPDPYKTWHVIKYGNAKKLCGPPYSSAPHQIINFGEGSCVRDICDDCLGIMINQITSDSGEKQQNKKE